MSAELRIDVFGPDGMPVEGRVVASHVRLADGLCVIGEPREGAPPFIVDIGADLVMFGVDGWELAAWGKPKPRHAARCLCPEAGNSEAGAS